MFVSVPVLWPQSDSCTCWAWTHRLSSPEVHEPVRLPVLLPAPLILSLHQRSVTFSFTLPFRFFLPAFRRSPRFVFFAPTASLWNGFFRRDFSMSHHELFFFHLCSLNCKNNIWMSTAVKNGVEWAQAQSESNGSTWNRSPQQIGGFLRLAAESSSKMIHH